MSSDTSRKAKSPERRSRWSSTLVMAGALVTGGVVYYVLLDITARGRKSDED